LKSAASRGSDEQVAPTSVGTGGAHGASAASAAEPPRTPFGRTEAVSPLRPPGVSQLLAVARLPIHAAFASASATSGDSHATTTEASASARSVCSVMWGSAQADRSIIASGSLPRTPSPAFGLGPRLFRASRGDSSEPRRPVPAPAGTPRPEEWTPPSRRTRRSSDQRTHPDGTRRRSSSEPRPPSSPRVRKPRLFGARAPPPGIRAPLRRGRPRRSSERWTHLVGPGRRSSSEPRPPPSPDPAPRFFGTGSPRPLGSASRPSGRGCPSPGWSRSYAPRVSGDRGRCDHRFRPALPRRAGRQRQEGNGRSDAFPAADEGNSSEGAKRTAGTDPCTRPPSGDPLQARTKRGEPSAGCGVQQTRNSHAEQTVGVVRNHEDGT